MIRSKWKEIWTSKNKDPFSKIERNETIDLDMIKKSYYIHNGKIWKKVNTKANWIGEKAGKFIWTKKTVKWKR
uniref:Ribosomal protein S19 n=1 Tax=Ministeria vibrans TaxID=134558 RepID=M1JZY1_MINVI|nr:ribosomal protein S19 [Ministeria vibrans]AGE93717.1 ribosomal protein S19 [Ministeria vibrans]